MEKKIDYSGWENIVAPSHGVVRNHLYILKRTYKWSLHLDEEEFSQNSSKRNSQLAAIDDAVEWFLDNSAPAGKDGENLRSCIENLGTFFRTIRYSDVPPEVSCSSFSFYSSDATEKAMEMIRLAEE